MNPEQKTGPDDVQSRPWYKEPWPWVIISIPAAAVIMGFITLYLALANPDYLVVKDEDYRALKSDLRAQPSPGIPSEPDATRETDEDGAH